MDAINKGECIMRVLLIYNDVENEEDIFIASIQMLAAINP